MSSLFHGAKHSPPGSMGAPDCLEGVPPLCVPGDPLAHDISGSSSSNEINSTLIIIVFSALSDGILDFIARGREHQKHLTILENYRK